MDVVAFLLQLCPRQLQADLSLPMSPTLVCADLRGVEDRAAVGPFGGSGRGLASLL
jgi:hypothetical protein